MLPQSFADKPLAGMKCIVKNKIKLGPAAFGLAMVRTADSVPAGLLPCPPPPGAGQAWTLDPHPKTAVALTREVELPLRLSS